MNQEERQEVVGRLLGVKVSLQEVLELPGLGDKRAIFNAGLEAAVELEEELGLD